MSDLASIPILPLSAVRAERLAAGPVLARLPATVTRVARRAPDPDDAGRWRMHAIDARTHRIAQPVTFTPYASATPCSARCRFCSETLVETGAARPSSALRPQPGYFDALRRALHALRGLPLSYSLSGLETTDDPHWMMQMLDALDEHGMASPVHERVLYTNGAGFAVAAQRDPLLDRLAAFRLDRIELSRHDPREDANQAIMRFRPGVAVREQACFTAVARTLAARFPVQLVCIVQQGGVADAGAVLRYLDWARGLGVEGVIFREFSQLDDSYADNVTARYVGAARVPMADLLDACLQRPGFAGRFAIDHATDGYYFWNVVGHLDGMRVTFEASDYARMHRQHASGNVYKLVFHANGNLCADWNPQRNVLLAARLEDAAHG